MANPAREVLSLEALFGLFHRENQDTRLIGLADSLDTLEIVRWIVTKSKEED